MRAVLKEFSPDVIAVNGWGDFGSLQVLKCGADLKRPMVMMSESTVWDEKRAGWKEWTKGRIVRLCSAGLAGGTPHADYLVKLGIPRERVFLGYDTVDNDYFAGQTAEARKREAEIRQKHQLPPKYFLASARFIEKKNLPRLLEAYARYRQFAKPPAELWDLVLLGDGAMRKTLESQVASLTLQAHVMMPGFKQYPDLPAFYAFAGAFVHASTTEQWGLVVNEAMAAGLPVLVSNRCGCAPDLVKEGINGFTFDPFDVETLAQLMLRLTGFAPGQLASLAEAGRKLVAEWGPARFASGLLAAGNAAQSTGPIRPGFIDRRLLNLLSQR
jgi:glycosyltransferase involved in cell wall biosynthesis